MPRIPEPIRSFVRPVARRVLPWRDTIQTLQRALAAAVAHRTVVESELVGIREYVSDLERRVGEGLVREEAANSHLTAALDEIARLTTPRTTTNLFLFTLPKSGSVYLVNLLARGLNCAIRAASVGYFPRDLLDWRKMEELRAGGNVVQAHLDAAPANVQILKAFGTRFQVHLRDPRQATLSMAHHLVRRSREALDRGVLLQVQPTPPPGFYECPLREQMDWMIGNYLPGCIRWIQEWLNVIASNEFGPNLLLTTYEEFVRDEPGFIRRQLDFFGIPENAMTPVAVERTMAVHYRQGSPDEWKQVLTPDQQARSTEMMPQEWVERFGWH